jgi:hypothetical protein
MNRVAIVAAAAFAIVASGIVSRVVAQSPANVPQHVQVNQMSAGTARGTTKFLFEWDQAKALGTNAPYTTYQIGKGCAYTFTGSDKAVGGNSGLTLMTGPGPHYKVQASCTCDRGVAYAMVRVYEGKATWVGPGNLPATLMKTPLAFYATCSPVR